MLHELLLALSGHSSPLFSDTGSALTSHLSSSELALLKQLAHLGQLHQETRSLASQIITSHESTICRAVAASITNTTLTAFQQKILEVERGILSKDQTFVGAYDIVPLSGIATAFAGWNRKLAWLKLACDEMRGDKSGAETIDWLRKESRTGFPDLEIVVLDLVRTAETAWLRQLSTWIFYGRLQTIGAKDFLIQGDEDGKDFKIEPRLCPMFVSSATANSILFIGRSLNHIKHLGDTRLRFSGSSSRTLLTEHIDNLSSLSHPIASTSIARIVTNIRTSLARNALRELLPMADIIKLLKVLQEFFLLARGEFSIALVAAADQCLQERHVKSETATDIVRLGGVMIKDAEVMSVLSKTWATVSALQDINDDTIDEILEMARDTMSLHIKKRENKKEEDHIRKLHSIFSDTLLATPTEFSISVSTPLNLFFTHEDAKIYTMINSYLLSIRRAHLHLTELWKLSALRRERTVSKSANPNRDRINKQQNTLRPVWAAISFATSFLTELGEYLQGEVIAESWSTFERWLQKDDDERDPEILGAAHRLFLASLLKLLILDENQIAEALRTLLSQCDQIVALIRRLEVLRRTLQAFEGSGTGPLHLVDDESRVIQGSISTAQRMNQSLKSLALQLNEMDTERIESLFGKIALDDEVPDNVTTFAPWKGSGIRSLLMRLDFRTMLAD